MDTITVSHLFKKKSTSFKISFRRVIVPADFPHMRNEYLHASLTTLLTSYHLHILQIFPAVKTWLF